MLGDSPLTELPDVDGCEYLISYWNELGRFRYGMDMLPFDHAHIMAYRDFTGYELDQMDAQILISMSQAYVAERRIAVSPNAKAPFDRGIKQVASPTLKSFLGG